MKKIGGTSSSRRSIFIASERIWCHSHGHAGKCLPVTAHDMADLLEGILFSADAVPWSDLHSSYACDALGAATPSCDDILSSPLLRRKAMGTIVSIPSTPCRFQPTSAVRLNGILHLLYGSICTHSIIHFMERYQDWIRTTFSPGLPVQIPGYHPRSHDCRSQSSIPGVGI